MLLVGKRSKTNNKIGIIQVSGTIGRPVSLKFKNVCIASDLFNYPENHKTNAKNVLGTNYVLHFCLQILFENLFTQINIWRVTLEIHAETHVGLQVKLSLKLFDLNIN
jgi:hypothetical protein